MGQIFQRTYKAKDGTVKTCDTWTIRYYRDGRPLQETGFKTKGAATQRLKVREGKIAEGAAITPSMLRVTIDQALADVVADYKMNDRDTTAHVERRIDKHLKPYFGGRRLSAIGTADIRQFIVQRQEPVKHEDGTTTPGASNGEINRELAILKRAFRLAQQAGSLLTRPHIPMLEEAAPRAGFFEREQFEAVRDRLPSSAQPVVTFAYLTGWRIPSEVLPLTWAQIDRKAQIVRLNPGATKNDEPRVFPYGQHPELVTLLEERWQASERLKKAGTISPLVFFRTGGETIITFRKAWTKACKDAGCPGRIPHDFRRTAVRNLVRAGVPEKTAMLLTGHKTRSVFDRYHIVSEQDLSVAVGKLADRDSNVTVNPPNAAQPAKQSA